MGASLLRYSIRRLVAVRIGLHAHIEGRLGPKIREGIIRVHILQQVEVSAGGRCRLGGIFRQLLLIGLQHPGVQLGPGVGGGGVEHILVAHGSVPLLIGILRHLDEQALLPVHNLHAVDGKGAAQIDGGIGLDVGCLAVDEFVDSGVDDCLVGLLGHLRKIVAFLGRHGNSTSVGFQD